MPNFYKLYLNQLLSMDLFCADNACRSASPPNAGSPDRGRWSRSLTRSRRSRSRYSYCICRNFGILVSSFALLCSSNAHTYTCHLIKGVVPDYFRLKIDLCCFRSRDSGDVVNPGNNLYVTGLSTRVSNSDLEKFFANEGKVSSH